MYKLQLEREKTKKLVDLSSGLVLSLLFYPAAEEDYTNEYIASSCHQLILLSTHMQHLLLLLLRQPNKFRLQFFLF